MTTTQNEAVQFERDYARMVQADQYILRHLAVHLAEAGQFERLYKLLVGNKAWMESKFYRLGGDEEYVGDLNLAMSNISDPVTASQLLILVQLRMARSVVNIRTNTITDEDVQTLVYLGQEQQALSSAKLRLTVDAKFNGLQSIWSALFKRGVYNPILLKENYELANQINHPRRRALALAEIAIAFSKAGDMENALAALHSIDDIGVFVETQVGMTSALERAGQTGEALKVVRNIHDIKSKCTALAAVAASLFQKKNDRAGLILKRSMKTARKLRGREYDFALSEIAKVLARNGCIDQARYIIKCLRKNQEPDFRRYANLELAYALARNKQFDEMNDILKRIEDADLFYPSLAAAIVSGGDLDRAVSLTKNLLEPNKSLALRAIVLSLAEVDEYDQLISIVPQIENRSRLSSAIAVMLAVAGDSRRAEILLKSALEENEIDYLLYSARLMRGDLAAALAVVGYFDLGITLASSIKSRIGHLTQTEHGLQNTGDTLTKDSGERTASLLTIATALTCAKQLDRALEIIKLIHGKHNKANARLQLSETLAILGEFDLAIPLAQQITFVDMRARALSKIGKALAEAGDDRAQEVLTKAVKQALRIVRKYNTTLTAVVTAFPPQNNPKAKLLFENTLVSVCDALSAQKRTTALWDISSALAQAGDERAVTVFDDMVVSVENIGNRRKRLDLLKSIAEALALTGNRKAREILLQAYELEYGSDNSYLPDFLHSFLYNLSVTQDILVDSKVLFGKGTNESVNQFFEAKLTDMMGNEDPYLKISYLEDIMITAAIIEDRHSQIALDLLINLMVENRIVDDLNELIGRLADAGSTLSSVLSYELMKLKHSYDDQIVPSMRLWGHRNLVAIAEKRLWGDTLRFLDLRNHPYELLGIFASWINILEKMESGFSVIFIREALRVAGWLGQDPYYIASLFVKKELHKDK